MPRLPRKCLTFFVVAFLFLSPSLLQGCDALMDADPNETIESRSASSTDKLRHPQLMGRATRQASAGKQSVSEVHLFLAFNEYEADGVTPRILNKYDVTRRILNQYGITRRVLDKYDVTRRILNQYGITRRILNQYDVTRRILNQYGLVTRFGDVITDSMLAQFDLTPAKLLELGLSEADIADYNKLSELVNEHGLTPERFEEEMANFVSTIRLKVRIKDAGVGITIAMDAAYLDVFLEEISDDPDILFVEPDAMMQLAPLARISTDPGSKQLIPWGIDHIEATGTSGQYGDVRVYVMDSGIFEYDLNIAEMKDFTMLFENRDQEFIDEEELMNMPFFNPGTRGNPIDESGHGAHVAGTIGAIDNSEGVFGVAPGIELRSLKVLTADGHTDITTLLAAIDYVINEKLQHPNTPFVVNMSLGADIETTTYNVLDSAVKKAIDAGIVVVVSAGNDARDARTYSPAHVEEAITVGAYNASNKLASFSNVGSVIDILAPGENIVSLTHIAEEAANHESILFSGTSFAAPHVTGAVARFLAQNPNASPAQVREALLESAKENVKGKMSGTTRKSVYVGSGDEKGIMSMQLPPFFQHAITSRDVLRLYNQDILIRAEERGANANVFTNDTLVVAFKGKGKRVSSEVKGFAYAARGVTLDKTVDQMFTPVTNPSGLPVGMQADTLAIPQFDARTYRHLATKETSGTLYLNGHYDLGTRDNPTLWFVDGAVQTIGDVTFEGYGVIFATDGIQFEHNVQTLDENEETTLGLYSNGKIHFKKNRIAISAQLFSMGMVVFQANTTLYGNITTAKKVDFRSPTKLYHRPASPVLTEPFWPMNGN